MSNTAEWLAQQGYTGTPGDDLLFVEVQDLQIGDIVMGHTVIDLELQVGGPIDGGLLSTQERPARVWIAVMSRGDMSDEEKDEIGYDPHREWELSCSLRLAEGARVPVIRPAA